MEETISRISDIPTPLRDLWNADTCPASLLPWLAWTFSVGDWASGWTEYQKRAIIKASVETHRKKGTVGAVRSVVNSFGAGFSLQEWWQTSPQGTPHTFTLQIALNLIPTGLQQTIIDAITRVKPVRSYFTTSYPTGYIAGLNAVALGNCTTYERFSASLS
jgi:phage tail P2-like protein